MRKGIRSAGRSPLPISAARRSITKRIISSKSSSLLSASYRWKTRPVFDIPLRSPVWGQVLAEAARRLSNRTCRTPTASSFRAPTWPKTTRLASNG